MFARLISQFCASGREGLRQTDYKWLYGIDKSSGMLGSKSFDYATKFDGMAPGLDLLRRVEISS